MLCSSREKVIDGSAKLISEEEGFPLVSDRPRNCPVSMFAACAQWRYECQQEAAANRWRKLRPS